MLSSVLVPTTNNYIKLKHAHNKLQTSKATLCKFQIFKCYLVQLQKLSYISMIMSHI